MNQLVSPLNYARTSVPIYHYGPDDRITIEDGKVTRHLTVFKQTTEGSVFKDADGRHHPYSHEQIYLLTVERRLKGRARVL